MTTTITGTTGVSQCQPGSVSKDDFASDVVLGTVSQSAGVPAGALMERGSNANGEYEKYACGTLICRYRAPTFVLQPGDYLSYGGVLWYYTFVWTYPAVFTTPPFLTGGARAANKITSVLAGDLSATTTGSLFICEHVSPASANSYILVATAIGRWF